MEYRWNVFLVDLDPVVGSEQGKRRPALIISDEDINQILPVVNILPITSRKRNRSVYPNEVLLPCGIGGIEKDSIILCYQIRTIDKSRLQKRIGKIEDNDIRRSIVDALCFQLGVLV